MSDLMTIEQLDDNCERQLREIIEKNTDENGEIDPEGVHIDMDKAIEDILRRVGMPKTAKLYAECPGWYN